MGRGFGAFLQGFADGYNRSQKLQMEMDRNKRDQERWELEKADLEDKRDAAERRKQLRAAASDMLKQDNVPEPQPLQSDPMAAPPASTSPLSVNAPADKTLGVGGLDRIVAEETGAAPRTPLAGGVAPSSAAARGGERRVSMVDYFGRLRDKALQLGLTDEAEAYHDKYTKTRYAQAKERLEDAIRQGPEALADWFNTDIPNGNNAKFLGQGPDGKLNFEVSYRNGQTAPQAFDSYGDLVNFARSKMSLEGFDAAMKYDFEKRKTAAEETKAAATKAQADAAVADREDKRKAGYWESEVRKNNAQASQASAAAARANEDKEPAEIRTMDALMKRIPGLSIQEAWNMVRTGKTKDVQQAVSDTASRLLGSQNPRYMGQNGMRNAMDDAAQIWREALEGREAGGAVKYPPAPKDPSQRRAGQIYMNPKGVPGRWTGQGWEAL